MREFLIRMAWMIPMFGCAYGCHEMSHMGHMGYMFFSGMLGGAAFICGEVIIRRPE